MQSLLLAMNTLPYHTVATHTSTQATCLCMYRYIQNNVPCWTKMSSSLYTSVKAVISRCIVSQAIFSITSCARALFINI